MLVVVDLLMVSHLDKNVDDDWLIVAHERRFHHMCRHVFLFVKNVDGGYGVKNYKLSGKFLDFVFNLKNG